MRTPPCIGEHEPCHPCDGNAADSACEWREICRGFQAHLAATGEQREDHIALGGKGAYAVPHAPDAFTRLCWEGVSLTAGSKEEGEPMPAPVLPRGKPPAVKKWQYKGAKEKRAKADAWARALVVEVLGPELGLDFVVGRRPPMVGQAYIKQRTEYQTVHVKGVDNDVTLMRIRTRVWGEQRMTIELAPTVEQLQSVWGVQGTARYRARPGRNGKFCTVVVGVNRQRFAALAEYLGKLVVRGIITLPGHGRQL